MTVYRSRTHDSLLHRLVDVGIGTVVGVPLGVLLWIATVWWLMG